MEFPVGKAATAKSDQSIFDNYIGQQLANGSRKFLANFAQLRLRGGGDGGEGAGDARKAKKSARFDPIPDLEKVEELEAKRRRRRRADVFVPQTEDADVEKKAKKSVRFKRTVKTQLYGMEEASPRPTTGGRLRRRVQLAEKIDVTEPEEDRRLKRPRGHLRDLPELTNKERLAILGRGTPRKLTSQRRQELITDNGCCSTCDGSGCGPQCLCLLNDVVCDDRCCPCTEESCLNAREDLDFEDSMTLRMRADLANYDLEDQSMSERSTIRSYDSFSLLSLYSLASDDRDEGDEEGSVADKSVAAVEDKEEDRMVEDMPMDVDEVAVVDGGAEGEEAEEVEMEKEGEDEDEEMDTGDSDSSSNGPQPANPVQPFAGVLPDLELDLEPKHFSTQLLDNMPRLLDKECIRSCAPGKYLDGQALFIGLLKEASRFNEAHEASGSRCAVLHPEVFHEAMRLAKEDAETKEKLKKEEDEERKKRKAARAAGQKVARVVKKKAAEPTILDPDTVAQLVVYGNRWTEMIIPMHISGNHWVVSVVQRSSVAAVIYDSLGSMDSRPKEFKDQIKEAVRKVLLAVEATSDTDTTTGRYKIRFCRKDYRSIQTDNHSCGLFAIIHARRVLARGNSNASTRVAKGEPAPDVRRERQNLRRTLLGLSTFYEDLEAQNRQLQHGPSGQLAFAPKKVAVKLNWSSTSRC